MKKICVSPFVESLFRRKNIYIYTQQVAESKTKQPSNQATKPSNQNPLNRKKTEQVPEEQAAGLNTKKRKICEGFPDDDECVEFYIFLPGIID